MRLDAQVAASADDVCWRSDYYSNNATAIYGGAGTFAYKIGLRFPGIEIPDGAVITEASISLYVTSVIGAPTAYIYAEDAANPSAIASTADGDSRTLTTEKVAWSSFGTNDWIESPDIADVITALMGSHSYEAGAAIQIILVGTSASSNYFIARSQDYTGNAHGAELHIVYTIEDAPTPLVALCDVLFI